MKKRIVLKDGAPPLDQLRAVLRVDVPYKFDLKNFDPTKENTYLIGHRPTDLLEAVNEEMLLLDKGYSDLFTLVAEAERGDGEGESPVAEEWVLVDSDNTVWSEYAETATIQDL